MKYRITTIAFCAVLMLTGICECQTSSVRDPQALAVLASSLNAFGGPDAINAIHDFTASGTITYNWGNEPVSGQVTVLGRGLDQFRVDADLPGGRRSWLVSKGRGQTKEPGGALSTIPYQNAINLQVLTFPIEQVLTAVLDQTMDVSYLGKAAISAEQAHRIRISRHFSSQEDPDRSLTNINTIDVFISDTSFLIVKTQNFLYPNDRIQQSYVHEVFFSDYRAVNGPVVPFAVAEYVYGQNTWNMQLTSISFNTGLTDQNFTF